MYKRITIRVMKLTAPLHQSFSNMRKNDGGMAFGWLKMSVLITCD